jgi:UDP-N-acetylmuramoylalanine--D-glutamate ligase
MTHMIPITLFAGQKVAVIGLGSSGIATCQALQAGGSTVLAWDDQEAGRERARQQGFEPVDLQAHDWQGVAALILAPGIPLTHPEPHWSVKRAQEQGIPVLGDVALFSLQREKAGSKASFIGITGTNGKSTTTALLSHCLANAGRDVAMGGNIGRPVLDLPDLADERHYVVECSSFQIDLAPQIHATIGIHLNLSEDHLDRHGTFERYAAIKKRLVAKADYGIVGIDDVASGTIADQLKTRQQKGGARLCKISTLRPVANGVFAEGSRIVHAKAGEKTMIADLSGHLALRGRHNMQNVCAVVAALLRLKLSHGEIAEGLASFTGLAHRMEPVGYRDNVLVINDSKATNMDAAFQALSSFSRIYWIAGGRAKEKTLSSLKPLFPNIVKTYLIGEASAMFAQELTEASKDFSLDETLERAVPHALNDALQDRSGDAVVLFSPACASFDQFPNFEVRGQAFKKLCHGHGVHFSSA